MEPAALEFGWNAAFFGSLFGIILIDIILSGDNSIVIAMAVQSLPPEKRRLGILAGAGAAVSLRVLFTFAASRIMQTPYLKLAGGLLILWIAVKLLSENADADPGHREARSLFHAVWIIMLADFTMSLDNVLAVAGASKGSLLLLWFGLGLSIPLVLFTSTLLSRLMGRFPVIVTLGAAVLGKVGGEMIAGDPVMGKPLAAFPHAHVSAQALGVAFVLLAALWLKRRGVPAVFPARAEEGGP
jgi:YjbE family integral membrane protein